MKCRLEKLFQTAGDMFETEYSILVLIHLSESEIDQENDRVNDEKERKRERERERGEETKEIQSN